MATDREIMELVLKVQGQAEVERLQKVIASNREELLKLNQALAAGSITSNQFAAQSKAFAGQMLTAQHSIDGLQKSVTNLAGNRGMGLMMLSQAIDDAQYGFRAIVNNIPGIVMSMGGSAGLAGATGIAAVAVNQLTRDMDSLKELMKEFPSVTGTVKDSFLDDFKEIRDTIVETTDAGMAMLFGGDIGRATKDRKNLERAKAEQAKQDAARASAIAGVSGIGVKGDREVGNAVRDAIEKAGGGEAVLNALTAKLGRGKTEEQTQLIRGQIARQIQSALKGEGTAAQDLARTAEGTILGPGMARALGARERAREANEEKALFRAGQAKEQAKKNKEKDAEELYFLVEQASEEDAKIKADAEKKRLDDMHKRRTQALAAMGNPEAIKELGGDPAQAAAQMAQQGPDFSELEMVDPWLADRLSRQFRRANRRHPARIAADQAAAGAAVAAEDRNKDTMVKVQAKAQEDLTKATEELRKTMENLANNPPPALLR